MIKTVFYRSLFLLIIALQAAGIVGCDFNKPVVVGFSGQLTGPHADMGVSGRDGVILAVDEINAAGGIAGRPVKLVIRDDKGTPEGARSADQELIDAGVTAIIGHMTSSQSMAALPIVQKAGTVLLSPTTSTPALTGKEDVFFRVISDNNPEARILARHVSNGLGIHRLAAIYDRDNSAFCNAFLNIFSKEFKQHGGAMVKVADYSSSQKPAFGPIVDTLRRSNPQGLLIITSAYDGGLIAQQPSILGWRTRLFGSGWSMSAPLIQNGGRAVEGMEFVHFHDQNSQAPEYLEFQKRYRERFQKDDTFMAKTAYESMLVLATALEKTGGRAKGLTETLPGISIKGLTDTIELDRFGDGVRPRYRIVIENGRFINKGRLSL